MKSFAKIVSVVFHPLILTTALVSILYLLNPAILASLAPEKFIYILAFVFAITFVIPLLVIFYFKSFGVISDFNITDKKERLIPFSAVFIFYAFASYIFLTKFYILILLSKILLIVTIVLFVALVITVFWKISIHSMAMGGVCGILMGVYLNFSDNALFFVFLSSVILSGLVMSARLILEEHSRLQVYLGAFVGFLIAFPIMVWF